MTWFRVLTLSAFCTLLTSSLAQGHTLFALVDTGELYASSDRGQIWAVRSTLPVSDAVGLIAGTTSNRLFMISRSGSVYRSLNAGMNWTAVGAVASNDVVDLEARSDGALLVLSRTGDVWVSSDQGASFTPLAALTGSNYVSLATGESGNLYALTATGEIEESADQGTTWNVKGTLPVSDAVEVRGLLSDLYVLTGAGLVFRSGDSGTSWVTTGTLSQVQMRGLTQDVDRLVAVTREGEVAISSDGTDWTWVGAVNQLSVTALANDTPYVIGIPEEPPLISPVFLAPPVPNPLFSGRSLALRFALPEVDVVTLRLLDVQGRQVQARPPEALGAGEHAIAWRFEAVPSGVYVVELRSANGLTAAARVAVLR
ncbi:MAG TPA: YCF48-related protein [Candidatus Eisenbacteria bacterium]|nr:YCF48-related protein [Candidatus Eisenbacteria bacterium]